MGDYLCQIIDFQILFNGTKYSEVEIFVACKVEVVNSRLNTNTDKTINEYDKNP